MYRQSCVGRCMPGYRRLRKLRWCRRNFRIVTALLLTALILPLTCLTWHSSLASATHAERSRPIQLAYRLKATHDQLIAATNTEDTDILAGKRERIRSMMRLAWRAYASYAWGSDELRPESRRGHSLDIFGRGNFGATIVDAADTLLIMGLREEYLQARRWIHNELNFDRDTTVSVFEMTIRFLGGLLSAYYLSGERQYLLKATQLADRLVPAFNSPSGLPYSLVLLNGGEVSNYFWAGDSCCILAEVGSLHMEFAALSELTGNTTYRRLVERVRRTLAKAKNSAGLYSNFLRPETGEPCDERSSLASTGDSFYEYLLKEWLRSGDQEAKRLFNLSMIGVERSMLRVSDKEGLMYLTEVNDGISRESRMEHLACFAGGMFALAGYRTGSDRWTRVGVELTYTCRQAYVRSQTGLGPESFRFGAREDAVGVKQEEKVFLLRPETVESYFYLWRLTGDEKYRRWAWDVVLALENYCRTDNGYQGIRNVYASKPKGDDTQQSYFLAETLKYLFLIFSDSSVLPLQNWVFNTEGHPLRVRRRQM